MIGEVDKYFYHGDHISSVVLVTDKKAKVVQQFAYMPFGELLVDNSTVDLDFRFSAKETDRESGLGYFGARYYDNTSAMWLGVDPLWEKFQGISPYNYCAGNPVMMMDVDGREPTPEEAAAMAAHVYGDKSDDILIGGWKLKDKIQVNHSGLQYGIYSRAKGNGTNEYALVFAGTNDTNDAALDIEQATGGISKWNFFKPHYWEYQFDEAINVGKNIFQNKKGEKTVIGHSLGGGLATAVSMKYNIPAVTFNPAALHDNTIDYLNLKNSSTSQIINYVVKGEIVYVQQGIICNLYPKGDVKFLNSNIQDPIEKHLMKTVINIINKLRN